jgi:hypothetical protein
MTVVGFAPRFTPDDLSAFDAIAWRHISAGLWSHITRQSHDTDRILIFFPRLDRPVFRLERDRSGTYTLWFQDRDGWHSISTGISAADCLSIWGWQS